MVLWANSDCGQDLVSPHGWANVAPGTQTAFSLQHNSMLVATALLSSYCLLRLFI